MRLQPRREDLQEGADHDPARPGEAGGGGGRLVASRKKKEILFFFREVKNVGNDGGKERWEMPTKKSG